MAKVILQDVRCSYVFAHQERKDGGFGVQPLVEKGSALHKKLIKIVDKVLVEKFGQRRDESHIGVGGLLAHRVLCSSLPWAVARVGDRWPPASGMRALIRDRARAEKPRKRGRRHPPKCPPAAARQSAHRKKVCGGKIYRLIKNTTCASLFKTAKGARNPR